MVRYYSNIVGKYGSPVQKPQKLGGLPISHLFYTRTGMDREYFQKVIGIYDRLSRYDADEGVVIVYGSMYGNTGTDGGSYCWRTFAQGVQNIVMHNVTKSHPSYILADIFRYKGLIIGSPTYSNQIFPEVESLLSKILVRELKDVIWDTSVLSPGQVLLWNVWLSLPEKSKFELVGDPVEMKQAMKGPYLYPVWEIWHVPWRTVWKKTVKTVNEIIYLLTYKTIDLWDLLFSRTISPYLNGCTLRCR